ncbi:hypothetical protein FXI36_24390 [Escherichia coli]|nr:hypothetical protein [Escherichia coli]
MAVFRQCEIRDKYLSIYKEAFEEVIALLETQGVISQGFLKITIIDNNAIQAWKADWYGRSKKHAHGAWDWQQMVNKRSKSCKKLDIAIWGDGILCGLSVGKISRGNRTVRLDYLEAHPSAHPLERRVTMIIVAVALLVAKKIGAKHVAVFNPVKDKEEKVLKHYLSYGFRRQQLYGRFLKNVLYKDVE